MKKILMAILVALLTVITVGCVSAKGRGVLFAGPVGQISSSSGKVEFAEFFVKQEKSDKTADIITEEYYGHKGPWKYQGTFNNYGYKTKIVHIYSNDNSLDGVSLLIDDNGNCIGFGEYNVGLASGKEIPEGAESITKEEAVLIAENFAENMLHITVEGYEINCLPNFDIQGRINYYEVIFDDSYKGSYKIDDHCSILVDGYKGRSPFNIRSFSTRFYKWIDRERVPEINVEKMDALINSKIFDEARKSTNDLFVDTNRLKLEISNREIIQSDEGKLYYECYVKIAKQLGNKDEDIWGDFYDTSCYIPLD